VNRYDSKESLTTNSKVFVNYCATKFVINVVTGGHSEPADYRPYKSAIVLLLKKVTT
jgi:hypothetical protein